MNPMFVPQQSMCSTTQCVPQLNVCHVLTTDTCACASPPGTRCALLHTAAHCCCRCCHRSWLVVTAVPTCDVPALHPSASPAAPLAASPAARLAAHTVLGSSLPCCVQSCCACSHYDCAGLLLTMLCWAPPRPTVLGSSSPCCACSCCAGLLLALLCSAPQVPELVMLVDVAVLLQYSGAVQ